MASYWNYAECTFECTSFYVGLRKKLFSLILKCEVSNDVNQDSGTRDVLIIRNLSSSHRPGDTFIVCNAGYFLREIIQESSFEKYSCQLRSGILHTIYVFNKVKLH